MKAAGGKTKGRFPALYVASAVLIFSLVMFAAGLDHRARKQTYIDEHIELLTSRLDATVKSLETFSRYVFEVSVNRPEQLGLVSSAWREQPEARAPYRDRLYELMLPLYERLESFDFRQLHFHFPDSVSFLRMHSPDFFGDDLSGVRESVRLANSELRRVTGFEEGRIFNGYRFVYPLFFENEHCGSVEVSFSMGSFISVLERLSDCAYLFAIKRSLVEATVFEEKQGNYVPSWFSDDYLFDVAIKSRPEDERLFYSMREGIQGLLEAGGDFGVVIRWNHHDYRVLFKSIRNLHGDEVAYLVTCDQDQGYRQLRSDFLSYSAIGTIGYAVLTVLLYLVIRERRKLKLMSTTDALTGLSNRRRFIELTETELGRSRRYGTATALIMLDIDDFKRINDQYGHNQGDVVLRAVARILKESLRVTDELGRWGGEEFIVLLPNTAAAAALSVAGKVVSAVRDSRLGPEASLTISAGVAEYRRPEGMEALVARADAALYQAKSQGKNRALGSD